MERCPNCRARLDGSVTCRRCGMELVALIAAEQAADDLIVRGIAHLAAADAPTARRDLTRALALHRTPFAELLLGLAEQLEAGGSDRPADAEHGPPREVGSDDRVSLSPQTMSYLP